MKYTRVKYAAIAVMALLSSCNNDIIDDNDNNVKYEEYVRTFIKTFGLIDPQQDWNMVESTTVAFNPGTRTVKDVDVLIRACDNYYLVASYRDIDTAVKMQLEVPDGTSEIYLAVDGKLYSTTPGGTVDLGVGSRADGDDPDNAEGDADDETTPGATHDAPDASTYNNLGWIIAAEDLGGIGDFDFNDVIVKIEYDVMTTSFAMSPFDWAAQDNNVNVSRAGEGSDKSLRVTAMAAGGTLPVWLHYVNATDDYVITPHAPNGYIAASALNDGNRSTYEWHQWFHSPAAGSSISSIMYNTGRQSRTGASVVLPSALIGDFSFSDYSKHFADDNSAADNIKGFYIEVGQSDSESEQIAAPEPGSAPKMFLIPDIGYNTTQTSNVCGWLWPKESVNIMTAYRYFGDWTTDSSTNPNWFTEEKDPKGGDVYPRLY